MRAKTVWAALSVVGLAACSNQAPSLFPIPNKSVETGKTLEFDIQAADGDGDPLEFGIEGKPAAAMFSQVNDTTARFQWSPIASDAGPDGRGKDYPVTFKVTDGIDVDTESIIITVTLGGAGVGAPVFISPADFTLDIDRSQRIECHIEVRDPDSAQVTLRLVQGIPGGEFSTLPGDKKATFSWTPSPAQIAERPVWGFRVGADDGQNPEVFQDITILLKGGVQKCDGTPPVITHQALADQRGSGDYTVSVNVTDAESAIGGVALYWSIGGGEFQKKNLDAKGGGAWSGTIPNPKLPSGETVKIAYSVCAVDQDGEGGQPECNQRACVPTEGRYSFTAYAAGDTGCQDDPFEPDDVPDEAMSLDFDQNQECYQKDLTICPGNVDWYVVSVPPGREFYTVIAFESANGALKLDVFREDGSTLVGSGAPVQGDPGILGLGIAEATSARTFTVRVQGTSGTVSNHYQMLLWHEPPCAADAFESNDNPNDAGVVEENVYDNLTCCGDPDWYMIDLKAGDKLEVLLDFVNASGDLDLAVFSEDALSAPQLTCQVALACSVTENDGELATVSRIPADGIYFIVVVPYEGARNTYDMTVVVTPGSSCVDDNQEPNDSPSDAKTLSPGSRPGLKICPNNEDWFKVYLYANQELDLTISFASSSGDLDLKLYDPGVTPGDLTGHQLAASQGVGDTEHIHWRATAEGYHYFRIYGYGGAANSYDLVVGVQ